MKRIYYILFVLTVCFMSACSAREKKPDREITQVMEAIFSCPDSELFDPETINEIGIGTTADKDAAEKKTKETEKWKKTVGDFFTEEGFQELIDSDLNVRYHRWAYMNHFVTEVNQVQVEAGNEAYRCTVDLTVTGEDGSKQKAEITGKVTLSDGKIQSIEEIEDGMLWKMQ